MAMYIHDPSVLLFQQTLQIELQFCFICLWFTVMFVYFFVRETLKMADTAS